jgi:hypothetical protein
LDFATADGFTGAESELERHLGGGFPAPEPPDWATRFAVARGTLLVAQTDADGNVRNVESPYKYGWLRYSSDDPNSLSVMVGTREIPFCDAQLAALEKERVSTSSGRLDVLTLWVDDAKRSAATALFQVDGQWTLVKMNWPHSPADGDGELAGWISLVTEASAQKR